MTGSGGKRSFAAEEVDPSTVTPTDTITLVKRDVKQNASEAEGEGNESLSALGSSCKNAIYDEEPSWVKTHHGDQFQPYR